MDTRLGSLSFIPSGLGASVDFLWTLSLVVCSGYTIVYSVTNTHFQCHTCLLLSCHNRRGALNEWLMTSLDFSYYLLTLHVELNCNCALGGVVTATSYLLHGCYVIGFYVAWTSRHHINNYNYKICFMFRFRSAICQILFRYIKRLPGLCQTTYAYLNLLICAFWNIAFVRRVVNLCAFHSLYLWHSGTINFIILFRV